MFLALWPAPDERAQLVHYQQQWTWPRESSPITADRLHLTLHFLGTVARERVAELAARLQVPTTVCELCLTRAEIWPRGLAVLRTSEPPAALIELHVRLAEALRALDLSVETRRFRPHVTLARRAAGASPPAEPPRLHWRIGSYCLVESVPGAGGGYHVVRHYG
ncbi:RNA 2',3'-cyclic phosphodiesterase [Accumulibacter sp.]|uniref:RNA 2',3'-cyclic phosphodiesterase n=1 Tax=Accumulibacter sp. TaxID=2053492 RepID=UPI0028C4DE63|nr:RNA 2',3'-cyclic phosphodiesterase [Accumulibacter sp.]